MPCSIRSGGARLVSTVTPRSLSALSPRPRTAASSVLRSSACTVRNAAPVPRDRGGRALDRRLDIGAASRRRRRGRPWRASSLGERKAAGEQQLEPDLVDADAVAERLDQRPAPLRRSARRAPRSAGPWRCIMQRQISLRRRRALRPRRCSRFCCASSLRLPSASKASHRRAARASCCGMTVAPTPTSRICRRCSRLRMAP